MANCNCGDRDRYWTFSFVDFYTSFLFSKADILLLFGKLKYTQKDSILEFNFGAGQDGRQFFGVFREK